MIFEFDNKNLEKLYTTGKSNKFRLPENIKKKFIMKVGIIEAATTIYDLRNPPSNNFEKLRGFENSFSIRVQDKYRLFLLLILKMKNGLSGK